MPLDLINARKSRTDGLHTVASNAVPRTYWVGAEVSCFSSSLRWECRYSSWCPCGECRLTGAECDVSKCCPDTTCHHSTTIALQSQHYSHLPRYADFKGSNIILHKGVILKYNYASNFQILF